MHIIYDDHPEDGEASPQSDDICDPLNESHDEAVPQDNDNDD